MKVPERIEVQLRGAQQPDLSGVIVQIKIRAGRKNPYFIEFPKTDVSGRSSLTAPEVIGQFEGHWESGLMDYDGSLEEADPNVEVSLYDPTWSRENRQLAMAWPLLKHERGRWKSRDEEYRHRVSCRNHLFVADPIVVNVSVTNHFELQLRDADDRAV